MAPDNVNPAPDPSAVAAQPAGTAPPTVTAPSTVAPPAIGGLAAPGAAVAPAQPSAAPTLNPGQQYEADAARNYQKAADLAKVPFAPPTVPHSRLMNIISALSTGVGAFGTAIATHGREGGIKEVEEVQGEQQRQKIEAQNAALAQRNSQINMQLLAGDTNHKAAQSWLLMNSIPGEINASHLKLEKEQQEVSSGALDLKSKAMQTYLQTGDPTLLPQINGTQSGTKGVQAPSGIPPVAMAQWKGAIESAAKLAPNDPDVKGYVATLNNPNSTSDQLAAAANASRIKLDNINNTNKSLTEQGEANKNAPLTDAGVAQANAGLLTRWQVMNPGAKALPPGFTVPAGATPAEFDRIRELMQQTENAKGVQTTREYTQGLIANGNTQTMAEALVRGDADPSQLSKRSSNYNAVLSAADKYSMETTGKHYNVAQASSDYKYATNIGTQNTLKYLNSVIPNMAELVKQSDAIGRTQLPALNNVEAWTRLNAGDPKIAAYYTTVTEVSDQIAKILQGGGTGNGTSDAKLKQAQDLFAKGFNPDQVKAVAGSLTTLLDTRKNAMIGDNIYLQKYKTPDNSQQQPQHKASEYPRPAGTSTDAKLMQVPGHQPIWVEPVNQKAAANAGAVEVQ